MVEHKPRFNASEMPILIETETGHPMIIRSVEEMLDTGVRGKIIARNYRGTHSRNRLEIMGVNLIKFEENFERVLTSKILDVDEEALVLRLENGEAKVTKEWMESHRPKPGLYLMRRGTGVYVTWSVTSERFIENVRKNTSSNGPVSDSEKRKDKPKEARKEKLKRHVEAIKKALKDAGVDPLELVLFSTIKNIKVGSMAPLGMFKRNTLLIALKGLARELVDDPRSVKRIEEIDMPEINDVGFMVVYNEARPPKAEQAVKTVNESIPEPMLSLVTDDNGLIHGVGVETVNNAEPAVLMDRFKAINEAGDVVELPISSAVESEAEASETSADSERDQGGAI